MEDELRLVYVYVSVKSCYLLFMEAKIRFHKVANSSYLSLGGSGYLQMFVL